MRPRIKKIVRGGLGAINGVFIYLYYVGLRLTTRITMLPRIPERHVLVLAPHADDEIIGCGGTLAEISTRGGCIEIAVLTDGAKAFKPMLLPEEMVHRRREEARTVAGELNAIVHFLEAPDGELQDNPPIDRLREIFLSSQFEAIFLPFFLDSHLDHAAVTPLLEQVLSQIPRGKWPSMFYLYQVQSPLGFFNVDYLINTDAYFSLKRELLRVYRSQTIDFSLLSHFDRLNARLAGKKTAAAEGFARIPPPRYFFLYRRWKARGEINRARPVKSPYNMVFSHLSGWREKKWLARLRRKKYPPPRSFYSILFRMGLRIFLQRIKGYWED